MGADQIPTRFIELVAECLAVPLTSIINHCIAKDYFPKQWKIARVSPVPKIDNPVSKDQLRPISVLPVLSRKRSLWLFKCRIMRTTPILFTIVSLLSVKGIPPLQP